jgi:two-component system CheB/CheR fusion protein
MLQAEGKPNLDEMPLIPFLERIDNQVSRLTRLISEILDLSRMEEGKLDLQKESFNMNDLVEQSVEDIRYSSKEARIKVFHDEKFEVHADKDRIGQVLINFITNAIKYSPDDKNIEVRIFKRDGDRGSVCVKDYGIGIAKIDQQQIFKRFYRVSGKDEETYAGFGIGLFLAKEIVERHEGSIAVKSKKGNGSEFIFTLPL